MLAVSICGPGQIEIIEAPRPSVAGPNDAVVMVSTAGVGPLDIERFRRGEEGVTPGGEFCGTVVEVGSGLGSFDLDDLVFATTLVDGDGRLFGVDIPGGHAEYVLVSNADATLVKTNAGSEERSLLAGGSLGLGAAAAELALGRLPEAGRIAVAGCDPCGMGALAWLRRRQARGVLALDRSPARATLAGRYRAELVEHGVSNLADIVIVGAVGDGPGIDAVARIVKPGGAAVFCVPGEMAEWHARFGDAGITAIEAQWPDAVFASSVANFVHMRMLDLVAAVSHVVPLDDAEDGYEAAAGPAPGVQKVLIKP